MFIDVLPTADSVTGDVVKGKICIVIDVLRATSVMITALNNGAKNVTPVLNIDEALEKKRMDNAIILGGERNCLKIDGFDLGNSPLEYSDIVVKDKRVVITTTNGTKAVTRCKGAEHIYLAGVINSYAIAEMLSKTDTDIVFVNAGTAGVFSLDDFITAGYIIDLLMSKVKTNLSDYAIAARQVYKSSPDFGVLKNTAHYNHLRSLGMEQDINYCFTKNIIDCIPEYIEGIVVNSGR